MADDLRTRIAAVFLDWCCKFEDMTDADRNDMADAVIRELNLREDSAWAWTNSRNVKVANRYVTGWQKIEEEDDNNKQ